MTRGRAKLAMSDGLGVWLLDAPDGFGDPGFHSHHAIQLTLALTGSISIEASSPGVTSHAAVVAADARHRLTGCGLIAIVFVDPEGPAGRGLARMFESGDAVVCVENRELHRDFTAVSRVIDELSPDALLAAGRNAIERLVPANPPPPTDARLERILAHLVAHPDDTLAAAAEAQRVFLSPERLRHLFVEHTGLPHKSWVVWRRMTCALREYSQGRSLTEAAHAAGFSDSAHLSRVFRRNFGLPATTLRRV